MSRLSDAEIVERWNSVAQAGDPLTETLIKFARLIENGSSTEKDRPRPGTPVR